MDHSEREIDELRHSLDYLWELIDIDQALKVERNAPDVVEVCKRNHEALAHSG